MHQNCCCSEGVRNISTSIAMLLYLPHSWFSVSDAFLVQYWATRLALKTSNSGSRARDTANETTYCRSVQCKTSKIKCQFWFSTWFEHPEECQKGTSQHREANSHQFRSICPRDLIMQAIPAFPGTTNCDWTGNLFHTFQILACRENRIKLIWTAEANYSTYSPGNDESTRPLFDFDPRTVRAWIEHPAFSCWAENTIRISSNGGMLATLVRVMTGVTETSIHYSGPLPHRHSCLPSNDRYSTRSQIHHWARFICGRASFCSIPFKYMTRIVLPEFYSEPCYANLEAHSNAIVMESVKGKCRTWIQQFKVRLDQLSDQFLRSS